MNSVDIKSLFASLDGLQGITIQKGTNPDHVLLNTLMNANKKQQKLFQTIYKFKYNKNTVHIVPTIYDTDFVFRHKPNLIVNVHYIELKSNITNKRLTNFVTSGKYKTSRNFSTTFLFEKNKTISGDDVEQQITFPKYIFMIIKDNHNEPKMEIKEKLVLSFEDIKYQVHKALNDDGNMKWYVVAKAVNLRK